jgi:hypothetical protein
LISFYLSFAVGENYQKGFDENIYENEEGGEWVDVGEN